jgi:hypothetical protein
MGAGRCRHVVQPAKKIISDFKKGYQPRINIVKDEEGDLVADSNSVLAKMEELFFLAIECTWG